MILDKDDRLKERINLKKKRLLDSLIVNEILKDKRLIQAFMDVPLEDFIPEKFLSFVKLYEDVPNLFYYDEQNPRSYRTISAPHMITIMLQGLALEDDDDLLILGAKSGYIAALAHKLAPKGEIVILEANSEIAKFTVDNLKKLNLDENVSVIVKNPLNGMPELSPWQKILVTGAIEQPRIYPLLTQLDKNGGVLFAPIGPEMVQMYTQILRQGDDFFGKKQLQVKFSPLITQLELNELEFIADIDEFESKIESNALGEEFSQISRNVNIKYTKNILDDVKQEHHVNIGSIEKDQKDLVLKYLLAIELTLKNLRTEEDIRRCSVFIDDLESKLDDLKKYKKIFELKIKRMQNILNEIRSFMIVRKELEKKSITNSDIINKKLEIINKQIEQIKYFMELIKEDIQRVKTLY